MSQVTLSGAPYESKGNLKKIRSPPVSRETSMDDGKFSLEKKERRKANIPKRNNLAIE